MLGDVRDATAQTITATSLLYIDKVDFDALLEIDGSIERALNVRPDISEQRGYPQFSWLEEGERPIKVLNKHPAVLIPKLFIPMLIGLALLLGGLLAQRTWNLPSFVFILGFLISLVPFGVGLYAYIDWLNDVYVVTNRRVIHRERIGIIQEQSSAAPLHAIQDIQQVQIGLLDHFFRFGDLFIETAGGRGQVIFRDVPNLNEMRDTIFYQIARARATARAQEREAIRQAMHHHFLGEEEESVASKPEEAPVERTDLLRSLLSPFTLARSFLPPTWHREGDTITWRKHWMALVRTVALPLLIFVLITAVVLVVTIQARGLRAPVVVFYVLASFILVPWLMWQFEDWQNDFYQVTSTRIIDVERQPFFLREERREASLEQITSVRFAQSFWGRILRYGDVTVETAAPAGTFTFDMVSRPQNVQSEIFAHINAARTARQRQEAEEHRAELLDWFSIYDEIKSSGKESPPAQESDE
jgi:uncharacterized membrane protein YdbT with pleckstrin-like domain